MVLMLLEDPTEKQKKIRDLKNSAEKKKVGPMLFPGWASGAHVRVELFH